MKRVMVGNCEHEIRVTHLGNKWGVRCLTNGDVNQEIRVHCRQDIGVAAAEMLRWEDKCGNFSNYASACRERFFKGVKYRTYQAPSERVALS